MKKKFTIIAHTKDLYNNSKMLENNIPTEYETKFRLQNKKITKILIRKKVSIK
jgi:tRNA (guanine-N7-)-methyltransferase